jgi:hypothetical protein
VGFSVEECKSGWNQGAKPMSESENEAAREAAEIAVELTEAEAPELRARRRWRVAGALTTAARQAGSTARQAGISAAQTAGRGTRVARQRMSALVTWLSGQVIVMGPRLRIRDQATLRLQFPGQSDGEIAALLVERAARASGAVGGATGAWAALPALPAFPAEVAAETLAVVGIEIKLVAELHEILGVPAQGNAVERARAYVAAWAHRRGVSAMPGGLVLAAGSPLGRLLRRRLAARVRRSTFSLAPLFTGAVAGAMLNRRETRKLGAEILRDLGRRQAEINAGG